MDPDENSHVHQRRFSAFSERSSLTPGVLQMKDSDTLIPQEVAKEAGLRNVQVTQAMPMFFLGIEPFP